MEKPERGTFPAIIDIVRSIPTGCVATYGQIANMTGTKDARLVGFALASNKSADYPVPWHRVVGKSGKISLTDELKSITQKKLLNKEGIIFQMDGSIDLEKYSWLPETHDTYP